MWYTPSSSMSMGWKDCWAGALPEYFLFSFLIIRRSIIYPRKALRSSFVEMQKCSRKACSCSVEFTRRKIQTLSRTVLGVLVYSFENNSSKFEMGGKFGSFSSSFVVVPAYMTESTSLCARGIQGARKRRETNHILWSSARISIKVRQN